MICKNCKYSMGEWEEMYPMDETGLFTFFWCEKCGTVRTLKKWDDIDLNRGEKYSERWYIPNRLMEGDKDDK